MSRRLIRVSFLTHMDIATSAIDNKTDTAIQHSLRQDLNKDVTVITIAHRLQTIMDADKIVSLFFYLNSDFNLSAVLFHRWYWMLGKS